MVDIVWRGHPIHGELEAISSGAVRRVGGSEPFCGHRRNGHVYINPRLKGSKPHLAVHILVWECFNGVHDHKLFHVHHIDHDGYNNQLSNLQKMDASEHMRLHALQLQHTVKAQKQSRKLMYRHPDGRKGTLDSMKSAALYFGVSYGTIQYSLKHSKSVHGHQLFDVEDDISGEQWLAIPDGPGQGIIVSDLGRVQSRPNVRTYGCPDANGYMHTSKWSVHYLVCYAFHGPPPSPAHGSVDHINRVRSCNRADNLRWATKQMQADNGLSKGVEEYNLETSEVVNTWISAAAAERETGIANQSISMACTLTRNKDKGFLVSLGPRKSGFRFTGLTSLMKRRTRELYLFTDKFRLPNGIHPIKRHGGQFTYYMFTKTLGGRTRTYTKTYKDREACVAYNKAWHAAYLIQRYWRIRKAFPIG